MGNTKGFFFGVRVREQESFRVCRRPPETHAAKRSRQPKIQIPRECLSQTPEPKNPAKVSFHPIIPLYRDPLNPKP